LGGPKDGKIRRYGDEINRAVIVMDMSGCSNLLVTAQVISLQLNFEGG
jgi:hypothetical protein